MVTTIIFSSIGAYLLGSISSAIIVCKLWQLPDPRGIGSGNPGATNVLRIGSKMPAICTLLGDALKGALAVLVARQMHMEPVVIAFVMVAVFIGHLYPVFFRFQGGKGVATSLGVLLALSWQLGVLLAGVWTIVVAISKLSSLAAVVAAIVALFCGWWFFAPVYSYAITMIVMLLLFRHRQNIKRLLHGQEAKIKAKH